ncbi:MAG TPA: ribonuclease R [Anaerolineae bacterium]|jgi:ribonuclease R|nr:ribonuclease R [Anaerolineae bacterium]
MQLTKQIIKAMSKKGYAPQGIEELASTLGIPSVDKLEIKRALDVLEAEGKVLQTKKGKYALPAQLDMVVGELMANRAGYGFARTTIGDIFIPGSRVNGAMHGDKVAVRVSRRKTRQGPRSEGEIVRIIERVHETVVGRYERHGKISVVVPADKRIFYHISVHRNDAMEARDGDMVVAKIFEYPDGERAARGRIVEVIGDETSPTIEIDVIVREHNLSTEFSSGAITEAEAVQSYVTEADIAGRRDYRDTFTVTIDGLDAKDFDDAISIRREENGHFHLGVHIADVSHYVPLGSSLDEDAYMRGTSVYLADRVLPMLPRKLSNNICSLNPQVDRLSLSVEMVIDDRGEVIDSGIYRGVINSNFRLTYEQVDEAFRTGVYPDPDVRDLLINMRDLSDTLEQKRLRRGSLNFETIEPKVILDEDLRPVDVIIRERTTATKIIEEAMIVTNETIASFMYWQDVPMVYRVHDKPSEEGLIQIEELIENLRYPVRKLKGAHPRVIQQIISYAHDRPEKLLINNLLLRAMKRAKYAPSSELHFGLASQHYTHFTSPIRRYPDLVVHRLVKAALDQNLSEPDVVSMVDNLADICEQSSYMEREADDAERESVDVKLAELMKAHVGEVFDGTITGVSGYGFFVQLSNTAEGLVHVRDLKGDFYEYDERTFTLIGRRAGRMFQIGQSVRVQVTNVIIGERRIDFVLAEE